MHLLHSFAVTILSLAFRPFLIALATATTGIAESFSHRRQIRSDRIRHVRSTCPTRHAEILQPPLFDATTCDDVNLTIAAFTP